jgi:hypothetical protein
MIITLEDPAIIKKPVNYELRFGFKCFMTLGKMYGLNTFKEVADKFVGFGSGEITLDQLQLIENLVIAAAESHPRYRDHRVRIDRFPIVDTLLGNPELLEEVVKEFVASFPQGEKGKPQPQKAATKTRAAKP